MTNPQDKASEAMHYLNSIIPQKYMGCMGLVEIEKLVPIREYIRTLEKEHRAMRDAIEYEGSHGLGCADGDDGEGCSCFKKVLSSLTIHD